MNENYQNESAFGWRKLISDFNQINTGGHFPLPAYSEYMPSVRFGCNLYGQLDSTVFSDEDPYGWRISEMEEEYELKPGIEHTGKQIMEHILKLGKGLPEYHIAGHGGQNLIDNPYWPPELAEHAGKLDHERYVVFLPMMLSRTQDDKGRVRWTFFGNSIETPEQAFWKSFYKDSEHEKPEKEFQQFMSGILIDAYGEQVKDTDNLNSSGFRILQSENDAILPTWTKPYLVSDDDTLENIKYLLTFRPFSTLPFTVKEKYLSGKLNLLPFPGSLVFWGMPGYLKLGKELRIGMQIPLLRLVARHSGHEAIRVPQSGWIYEPHPDVKNSDVDKELLLDTYHRTHRWEKVHKNEDELMQKPRLAKIAKVLFSTELDAMGLYDKPMARNCQLWTKDFELLLDGAEASAEEIKKAESIIVKGGLFGYRFFYPPMSVGNYDVYWQRPIVAYLSHKNNEIEINPDALSGYILAYKKGNNSLSERVELYPSLLRRQQQLTALQNFNEKHDKYLHQTALNILNLSEQKYLFVEKPIPRSFARHVLHISKHETLEQWLSVLPEHANDIQIGKEIQKELENLLESANAEKLPESITYKYTATREFEECWWNDINFSCTWKIY